MSRLQPGKYRARGRWARMGWTSGNNPQAAAELEITEEGYAGETIMWFGQFTEKTEERTVASLRLLGWDNDDFGNMTGIGSTDVEIVLAEDEYEGKISLKVRWINPPGGGASLKSAMTDAQAQEFSRRMKGLAVASRTVLGGTTARQQQNTAQHRATAAVSGGRPPGRSPQEPPPHTDDDIPF